MYEARNLTAEQSEVALTFHWEAEVRLRQFTLELSEEPDFAKIRYLRDTDKGYWKYDGTFLEDGKTYYWRIRSGAYPWVGEQFLYKSHI